MVVAIALPNAAAAAKPKAPKVEVAKTPPAPAAPAAPKSALRADAELAKLLAAIDKALATPPPPDGQGPDPAGALLDAVAHASLVSVLHGHFALTGLGHAVKAGAINAQEVGTMAKTLATNYVALGKAFGNLAAHKQFAGELADIFRAVQALCGHAQTAGDALVAYAAAPNDTAVQLAFDSALENYRQRVAGLFVQLNPPAKAP